MKNKVESKKIFLVVLFTIILITVLGVLFYVNLNKETSKEIKATIKYRNAEYIIAITDDNEEYLLETTENFQEGDKILVNIDKINKKKNPMEAEVKEIKLVSRSIKFTITDPEEITNDINNNITKTETTNKNDIVINSEEDVINYIKTVGKSIDDNNGTFTEELKDKFIMVVDFIFYNEPIGNYTFSSLSTTAKLKVLEIALSIDEKIETKFPDYKEQLSNKYQNIKSKIIEKYLDITTEVCSKNENTCKEAKAGFSNLKKNFKITWSFVKEAASAGISKLKRWYEIWRTT